MPLFNNFQPTCYKAMNGDNDFEALYLKDITKPDSDHGVRIEVRHEGAVLFTNAPQPEDTSWRSVEPLEVEGFHLLLLTTLPLEECTFLINNCLSYERSDQTQGLSQSASKSIHWN